MAWNTLALVMLIFSTIGFYFGMFSERDSWKLSNRRLRRDLDQAYAENDELRELIYKNFGSAIRQLDSN